MEELRLKILDRRMQIWAIIGMVLVFCLNVIQSNAFGYEITDKFSIGGILAGAYQYEDVESGENHDRGALPFQPEISFTPTENDAFFTKFGFAAGNGLNDVTSFTLSPWGADLEDDVKDINGRNRDYLLTVWYKHTFQFNESHTLGLTGGIIDATDYLDDNVFSNDEYTQFLNEGLVSGPNTFAPSYDIGGALEWDINKVSVRGVVMNVGENDDGNNFNFLGLQIRYNLSTPLGEGNYRLIVETTNKQFLDPQGEDKERRFVIFFSFDQEFGEIIGGWIRVGRQDDAAAIDFENLYSGGINIDGKLWGREEDNIGIGYGYLDGGNLDNDNTQYAELYARLVINKYFAVTPDIQYMRDKYKNGDVIKGFILGIRLAAGF
ncbi:MAG: carbohydrate porin [Syntrophobacterales bacterium]|jgi:porin